MIDSSARARATRATAAYNWRAISAWCSRVRPAPMPSFISRDKDGSSPIGG
jgi:hypothetical protein